MLNPKLRDPAFLKALSSQIWDAREIRDIAIRAGLARGDIPYAGTPILQWTEVFQLAYNYGVLDELLADLKVLFMERAHTAGTVVLAIDKIKD